MLDMIMIALASIAVALVVVWLYRRMTESRGGATSVVSLSEDRGSLRLIAQHGFVRLHSEPAADQRRGRKVSRAGGKSAVNKRKTGVRKPWGW